MYDVFEYGIIRVVKMCWNAGFYGVGTIKIFFFQIDDEKNTFTQR